MKIYYESKPGELQHGLFGTTKKRKNAKYIAKIPMGNGKFRYFYNESELRAYNAATKVNRAVGAVGEKIRNWAIENDIYNPVAYAVGKNGEKQYIDGTKPATKKKKKKSNTGVGEKIRNWAIENDIYNPVAYAVGKNGEKQYIDGTKPATKKKKAKKKKRNIEKKLNEIFGK